MELVKEHLQTLCSFVFQSLDMFHTTFEESKRLSVQCVYCVYCVCVSMRRAVMKGSKPALITCQYLSVPVPLDG